MLQEKLYQAGDISFTLGTLITISLVVGGVWFGLVLLRKIIFAWFNRRGLDKGRRDAIYLLIKYFTWTLAIVVCLELIGIHVTILIAGSAALLVGLGLGLQQIFQDLVSGIFILIEGTIKTNDVIELDGMVGKILSVNLRTSKILTRDGIIIIVPNHKFIVEKITNWSHNSDCTRFKVEVGVAYGSDVDLVKMLLLSCASEHQEIIKKNTDSTHQPFVRFTDFGDSSLKFELYFWTNNIFHVEFIKSDLRFAIDRQFRAHKITIPFPQRDIHIK